MLQTPYGELKRLLESFFDDEVALVPLHGKEWLVLAPSSLLSLSSSAGSGVEAEETIEETLESLASGLHEMIASEWVGECHVAVSHPCLPAETLLSVLYQLRQTVAVGRRFDLSGGIFLPWRMRLEQLLFGLSETEKARYVEDVLGRGEPHLDTELIHTLETFFALDCNVSETAKRLYIHRNTLLYRLDKLKQELGLDARTFEGAVLLKLALLLYKVTKRK